MALRNFNRPDDFLDAAREMADSGRPALARLLVEEAANRTSDPREAARIRDEWLGPNHHTGD
ncbi:hypothetical protein [Streptomyces lydicus]|uniref:hypothetical protein n=1 Tax=Streptomyces lydicus TaxID=47763 RepID=UPI0036878FAB